MRSKSKEKSYLCSYVKQRHVVYCPNSVYMFKWGPLFLQLHFCAQDYLQEYLIACIATNTVAKFSYPIKVLSKVPLDSKCLTFIVNVI